MGVMKQSLFRSALDGMDLRAQEPTPLEVSAPLLLLQFLVEPQRATDANHRMQKTWSMKSPVFSRVPSPLKDTTVKTWEIVDTVNFNPN